MPHRGSIFWLWADCELHHRTRSEVLDDGIIIDVHARLSRKGDTQLFLGVYSADYRMIHEEAYLERAGDTITTALLWGMDKARSVAAEFSAGAKSKITHDPGP